MSHTTDRFHRPAGAGGWGATSVAIATVLLPQLLVLAVVPAARDTVVAARAAGLVSNAVVVASGIYLYLHHRLTSTDSSAGLASVLIAIGGTGLTVTAIDVATPKHEPLVPLLLVDLLLVLTVILTVRLAERVRRRGDPAVTGLLLAALFSVLTVVVVRTEVGRTIGPERVTVLVPLVALAAFAAFLVRRLVTLPSWAGLRIAPAVLLLLAGRAVVVVVADGEDPSMLVAAAASATAAVLVLCASLSLLRLAIDDDRQAITALRDQLLAAAALARADHERLHEVKGTIAGIASASRLIHHEDRLPAPSREILKEMLERESHRLMRLVHGDAPGPMRLVDVDDVLRPLVVSRRAQGLEVDWEPSGLVAWTRDDDLAEAVSILLDNAARHAPGAPVLVQARACGAQVQVSVTDAGPGVPPELRSSLFARGVRGPQSQGDGLGLHVAERLLRRNGGTLRLADEQQGQPAGASFVLLVPRQAPQPTPAPPPEAAAEATEPTAGPTPKPAPTGQQRDRPPRRPTPRPRAEVCPDVGVEHSVSS